MRPRRMSRITLPVVLIAAAAAWPTGASASGGLPSAPPDVQATNAQPSASDGFERADAGLGAAVAAGLLGMAGGTLLLSTRARRRTT
jgi:PPE-repeat protein